MTQHIKNGEGVERDMSGETVLGFRVAAYRETHPVDGAKYGHTYSEHWSTPNTRDPRVKVERLFTEDQLRQSLAREPATADVGRAMAPFVRIAPHVLEKPVARDGNVVFRQAEYRDGKHVGYLELTLEDFRRVAALSRAAPSSGQADGDRAPCVDCWIGTFGHTCTPRSAAPSSGHAMAEGGDEFATVEAWEHDDQRELSLLYNHRADDSLQFNRGQMREAIRHGRRLATTPPTTNDAIPAGWKLVPEKPTPAMVEAWANASVPAFLIQQSPDEEANALAAECDWAAMLSAAPSATATEAGEEA